MRVFLTGASGLLGGLLIQRLLARGDQVWALSRHPPAGEGPAGLAWIAGDVTVPGAWQQELDETAALGSGFLADLCRSWEAEAGQAAAAGARPVFLRMGVVLSNRGGAMDQLRRAFSLFVGGPLGDPDAWFPWIHEEDVAGLLLHALDGHGLEGPVNGVAPEPVRMRDFARALGRALHRPALLPVPALALRLLLGEMASMVNPGLKVVPRAALAAGYRFAHPTLAGALADLYPRG